VPEPSLTVTAVRSHLLAHIDAALARLEPSQPLTHRSVHEARKEIKRARALAALLRPSVEDDAYRMIRRSLRDAAKPLGAMRDAKVINDALNRTLASLQQDRRPLANVTRAVRKDLRDARAADGGVRAQALRARRGLLAARRVLPGTLQEQSSVRPLSKGLRELYRKGRQRTPATGTRPGTDQLHDWRKQVKNLQYAIEPFEDRFTKGVRRIEHRATKVGEWLGSDHDLAVLAARLERFAPNAATLALLDAIKAERRRLQRRSLRAGRQLYAESPARFASRLG
jgi:CHAD domain-containing protein